MKKYALLIRTIDRNIFEAIRSGKKKVETRAAIPRYRNIGRGDIVVFTCGKDKYEKKVKQARVFKSITIMLNKYKVKLIAPGLSSVKELRNMYYSFPNYREKLKKFGIIAWELE